MNSHHSPALGPWSTDGRVLRDANGISIASGGNNRMIIGPELAASLNLAAAAPDLLEALRNLEAAVRQFTNAAIVDWPELTAARAAIARAQGEA